MAITQLRSNSQLMNDTITHEKMLQADFLQSTTWTVSSDDTGRITGLNPIPVTQTEAVTKSYVDGLVDSSMKSPDGYDPTTTSLYPVTYKGRTPDDILEGDYFYITDISR